MFFKTCRICLSINKMICNRGLIALNRVPFKKGISFRFLSPQIGLGFKNLRGTPLSKICGTTPPPPTPPGEKQNGFRRYTVSNKVALWAASYSAFVVYTKTIIHLGVAAAR